MGHADEVKEAVEKSEEAHLRRTDHIPKEVSEKWSKDTKPEQKASDFMRSQIDNLKMGLSAADKETMKAIVDDMAKGDLTKAAEDLKNVKPEQAEKVAKALDSYLKDFGVRVQYDKESGAIEIGVPGTDSDGTPRKAVWNDYHAHKVMIPIGVGKDSPAQAGNGQDYYRKPVTLEEVKK